jgi:2-C-methyl-D-erythritol 4-phosphate cytidylyltransferase
LSIRRATPKTAAIVVAAGQSRRFLGETHKLFAPLGGEPMILRALESVARWPQLARTVLVINPAHQSFYDREQSKLAALGVSALVAGGVERQDSVRAGLAMVPEDVEVVLVHDAARPLTSAHLIRPLIEAAHESGAAILAIPVADTLKRVENGVIRATVDRKELWQAQTPQAFRLDVLRRVMLASSEALVTDEALLCERAGVPVRVVAGEPSNLKITTVDDLALAQALFAVAHPESTRGS